MFDETQTPVPKRLREAMEQAGISQKMLGIQSGIDRSVASSRVNHYCTGRHAPNFKLMEQMAVVLKVPVAFFYCREDDLARLIASYPKLSARDRKEIGRTAERLAAG